MLAAAAANSQSVSDDEPVKEAIATLTTTTTTVVKVVNEGMQSGLYSTAPAVSYGTTMPAAATPKPQALQQLSMGGGHVGGQQRTKGASPPTAAAQQAQQVPGSGASFQRLKVEDALSYLDMVKYKFCKEPQVYNDFLDIMKEFKSQSIDTPGVIHRVSNLFHGFPDLIVGFNTFLPPGYKIEVQQNNDGYAFHVSVSAPSPTGAILSGPHQQKPSMILSGSGPILHHSCVPNMSGSAGGGSTTVQSLAQAAVVAPQPSQQPPPTQSTPSSAQQTQQSLGMTIPLVAAAQNNATFNNSTSNFNNANLHHNSAANTLQLSAQAAVVTALGGGHSDTPQNQPVEFNHAINYVNKIKNRFQGQPEKYKRFLEILHTYQKEQRNLKEVQGATCTLAAAGIGGGAGKHLTEQEVYSQVAKLFENQSDLLAEFGQFLPDATSHISQPVLAEHAISSGVVGNIGSVGGSTALTASTAKKPMAPKPYRGDSMTDRHLSSSGAHKSSLGMAVKRSPPYSNPIRGDVPPTKKQKLSYTSCRDVSLSEASKHSSLKDFAFFDKVRKAVRTQEVYNNFLRCLSLFNQEVVSKSELMMLITPFLGRFPELIRWFRDFLGQSSDVEAVPLNATRVERPQGELAHDIDYSTAKRLGASYCVIPPSQEGLRFSGRTQLCDDVLNNQWVSFPTWSEDSSFVGSRKNQYEEYMYRCEDERFELDVVIETNASTIRVLEGVTKKMSRMGPDELYKFRLDDCLGGNSPVLHQRALHRIYGDKAPDIIDGLKRNPAVAVAVIMRRLKVKEKEWREAQKGFNKIWREQNEKHYLKSLDYQGINFKQNDTKALRSKSLFGDIEQAYEERNDQVERGLDVPITGPHWTCVYNDRSVLDDAANLLIHHVKRHTGIQKGEKRRIKHLLRHFLPDLFFHPRQALSDDEREDDEDKEEGNESPASTSSKEDTKKKGGGSSPAKSPRLEQNDADDKLGLVDNMEYKVKDEDVGVPPHAQTNDPDEEYTLFMGSSNWYLFLRLHAVLCERLAKIYECAAKMAAEESRCTKTRRESTSIALRLKPKPQIRIEDYFPTFLDLVKNLLDGNTDPNTYEDTLREMFGIHAYIAFTLDKVIQYAMRQLQHCVTEKVAITAMEQFGKEQKRGATGGACSSAHRRLHKELQYQRSMEKVVHDENLYKIYVYKNDGRMTIELLEADTAADGNKVEEQKKWSTYKENYADCSHAAVLEAKPMSPLFLSRNMRKYSTTGTSVKKAKRRNSTTSNADKSNCSMTSPGEEDVKPLRLEVSSATTTTTTTTTDEEVAHNSPLEREQTEHRDFDVVDETQCRFNTADPKIKFIASKDSFLYKRSALTRAKQTHPTVTKCKSNRFRAWCERWVCANVSDALSAQCTEWLMGRGENVVPNRTRVVRSDDVSLTPYTQYNRFRVELLGAAT